MEHNLGFMTGNLILDLSFISWFLAQLIKLIIEMAVHHSFDIKKMWSSGGMPSSHSSFVCAAASSIGMIEGWQSSLFALSMIFAGVVMYDACNVRRAAGEQAKILNFFSRNWEELYPTLKEIQLKELLGHTPLQVFAGACLGVATGCLGVIHWGG